MHRGLRLEANKAQSTKRPLSAATPPATITLSTLAADDSNILVSIGDPVLLGQPLVSSKNRRLHASVSGRVTNIGTSKDLILVTIGNDGRDVHHESILPIEDYQQLTPEQLREGIERSGIVGLGGASFPTTIKLNAAHANRTQLLIVNGVECEPFITCDDALMRTHAAEVILGTQVLLHASGAEQAIIAVETDKPEALDAMSRALTAAKDERLRIQSIATVYPSGGERQLIQSILEREVPTGGIPADVDVLCHNVGTAMAAAKYVSTGEPLISRIVTVTGTGVSEPQNLLARFGTPISSLVADCGGYQADVSRLIVGGTMMGVAVDNDSAGVNAAMNCVIAASANDVADYPSEMPCIRCGDCATVCPANLLPQQLIRYAKLDDRTALDELGLRDCIECGCCDYVCPSHIRLASTFGNAKLLWRA